MTQAIGLILSFLFFVVNSVKVIVTLLNGSEPPKRKPKRSTEQHHTDEY